MRCADSVELQICEGFAQQQDKKQVDKNNKIYTSLSSELASRVTHTHHVRTRFPAPSTIYITCFYIYKFQLKHFVIYST